MSSEDRDRAFSFARSTSLDAQSDRMKSTAGMFEASPDGKVIVGSGPIVADIAERLRALRE
ncbi:MAG TPA: hypothetical protein VMC79_13955 [Rectinemataceae bacterium]|nr:hypothetical protein [Rectinemataceae bacterium]